jgi:hypothetical protein
MLRLLFLLTTTVSLAAADFPAPYNSEPGNPSPMSPQEALKALKLPEGFKATLFAAEPDVQNPIGMAWDAKGRMWVAENYTYAERQKRFDLSLKDRVIILEDKDWDGVAETRKVFTEDVQMLTSVEVGAAVCGSCARRRCCSSQIAMAMTSRMANPKSCWMASQWRKTTTIILPTVCALDPMAGSTVAAATPAPAGWAFQGHRMSGVCP